MSKKIIHVILRNKIIGIDSILPLCMEINGKCGYDFNFISLDKATFRFIMEDNIVLRDAIKYIGKIELVSSDKYKSRYMSKIFFFYFFLKVILGVSIRNDYVIHSAHLHSKPFIWIRRLFKRKNVIFSEASSFGATKVIDFTNVNKDNLKSVYSKRLSYDEIIKYGIDMHFNPPLLYAGILVGFDKKWNYFKHPEARKLKKMVFKNLRRRGFWIDFTNKHANKYIKDEMPICYPENSNILVFIATRIHRNIDYYCITEFFGALKALSKYMHNFPLFIKLHTFSDIDFINELLDIALGSENSTRYVITTLHPAVLSTRAMVSVFANAGSIMQEFLELGTPVIDLQIYEYTLPDSYFRLSEIIPKDKLKARYKNRKKFSDYTFSNTEDFNKFMCGVISADASEDTSSSKHILSGLQINDIDCSLLKQ